MLHPFPASRARPFLLTLGVIAMTLLMLLALSPGTARAACASSTPNSASFADLAADAQAGAPEILSVDASLNGGCGLTIDPKLAAGLAPGQDVDILLGFDPSTNDPNTETVNLDIYVPYGAPPELYDAGLNFLGYLSPAGQAGFTASLDQLGLPASRLLGIAVVASGVSPLGFDWAPETNELMHRFQVAFTQPPPPPPPAPPAPPAAKPAAPATKQATGCVVPKLKGLSVKKAKAALKKAGCKYKLKGKGRVRSFTPKAGTRTSSTVQVKCKSKRKKKRSRSALLAQVAHPR